MKVVTSSFCLAAVLLFHRASGKVITKTNQPPPIDTPRLRARVPTIAWISMKVDNFNPEDTREWKMRYSYSHQHFQDGGPILIYLGGEWEMNPASIQGGQIYDMAVQHGGALYYTEHRYYGHSLPTKDLSTANLKYLSVDQALADVAAFIRHLKSNPIFAKSKVVVVGGSYSATMATWGRMMYPNLIDAAYASSAPLLALDDFEQYIEVVGDNIKLESPKCWYMIKNATDGMAKLFNTQNGRKTLGSWLNTCKPLQAGFPYQDHVFAQIGELFAGIVQYAQPGQIQSVCNHILGMSGSPTQKLAAFVQEKNGDCLGNYDDAINMYKNIEPSPSKIDRQWTYQTCNEFGFFQTGNSMKQPFGRNWFVTLSHKICEDAYGPEFTECKILNNIDATNLKYNGLHPNVTQVISIHGSVDPWHAIGLLDDLHSEAPAILVHGTSHCADLRSISPSDSVDMKNAKLAAQEYIAKWIS